MLDCKKNAVHFGCLVGCGLLLFWVCFFFGGGFGVFGVFLLCDFVWCGVLHFVELAILLWRFFT